MRLTNIILAALPAFVLAAGDDEATTTLTSTLTRTKYITLSAVDTALQTNSTTSSASATPTPGSNSSSTTGLTTVTSATTSGEAQPTKTDEPGAASALDVARIAYAGALGAIVVALM